MRAAIDIGTNSTRLLIVDADGRIVERLSTITRLGQGVDASGRLAPEAIDRTCATLVDYRAILDRHGVNRWRAITTSAARDAANREEFFDRAEVTSGIRPELLSGTEEAAASFRGATTGLDVQGPVLMIDIGGGSTEFVLGTPEGSISGSISCDIGSVRLTERELHRDPPAPEELANAMAIVRAHLDDVERAIPDVLSLQTLVGVAGTITTVAAVELGLLTYDRDAIHRFHLSRAAAEDVFRTLATESVADRRHNPGLDPARADIIVGGCCILVGVMRWLAISELVVSETDILDGIVAGLTE